MEFGGAFGDFGVAGVGVGVLAAGLGGYCGARDSATFYIGGFVHSDRGFLVRRGVFVEAVSDRHMLIRGADTSI